MADCQGHVVRNKLILIKAYPATKPGGARDSRLSPALGVCLISVRPMRDSESSIICLSWSAEHCLSQCEDVTSSCRIP